MVACCFSRSSASVFMAAASPGGASGCRLDRSRRCTAQRTQHKISTLHCVGGQQEDTPMRRLTLAVAAGALLVATQANAGSFPVNRLGGAETGLVDQVAVRVFVHEGRRYCFYFDGWHGPGWYRCGFAWRRGLGWGGVYGWNSWTYGPWERRHGHGNWDGRRHGNWDGNRRGDRVGIDSGSTRSRSTFDSRTRSRTTTGAGVESNRRVRGEGNVRGRSEGNVRGRSTTGSGGADVRSGGGARIQGGGNASPSVGGSAGGNAGGGASVGGGASGGGGERR